MALFNIVNYNPKPKNYKSIPLPFTPLPPVRYFHLVFRLPSIFNFCYLFISRVAVQKPVGILNVKVVRAIKLLKMDILGTSDPYVKLKISGEKRPSRKTSIKMRNLNPEWNEDFKLIVKDPETQVLELKVYDWDKVFFISSSLSNVFVFRFQL